MPARRPTPSDRSSAAPAPVARGRKNLGVRLSEEDRAFLAALAPGAAPSDAVRTAISQLRDLLQRPASVQDALAQLRPLCGPVVAAFHGEGVEARSVVGEEVLREAWNILAQLRHAALTLPQGEEREAARMVMERLAVEGGFTLADALLRQTLPQTASSLEPAVVRQRFRKSKDLMVTTIATVGRDEPPRSRNGG